MRASPRGRARAAFTVIELMIVVTIIGVMAASVVPSLTELRADGRQTDAAQAIVHFARRARSHAMETGVAHLVRFQSGNNAAGSFGLGRFELFSGMTNRCRQTPWLQPFTVAAGNPLGVSASRLEGPDALDMAKFNPSGGTDPATANDDGRPSIAVRATGGFPLASQASVQICFQPNGQIYEAFSATAVGSGGTGLTPQLAPITFTVLRTMGSISAQGGGVARGVPREVVIPMGGSARVRY